LVFVLVIAASALFFRAERRPLLVSSSLPRFIARALYSLSLLLHGKSLWRHNNNNNPLSSHPRSHKEDKTKNKNAQKRAHAGKKTPRRRKVVRALKKSFAFATSE